MTTVAFIGLGIMGAPMAINLVRAGFDVTGFNRSPDPVRRLVEAGGRSATSVAEAVGSAQVVATMLPDSADVAAVVEGPDGVLAHAPAGALVIDFSTIRPETSVQLARAAEQAGLRMLDAPVSGGEGGARDATLSIMVGGKAEDLAAAQPVLDALGTTVVHVGPAGSGQTVKAANQLIVAGTLELVAEALVFLEANDVDTGAALRVLSGGLAGSTVLQRKAPAMVAGDYRPGFRVTLHEKDLGILMSAARQAGVVLPLGAMVAQLFGSLKAQGRGDLDHTVVLELVRELSGQGDAGRVAPTTG
jgi:2-hydroxy-3-oxopropionate reductase